MATSKLIYPKKILLVAQAPEHFYRNPLIPGAEQLFIGPDVQANSSFSAGSGGAIRLDPGWLDGENLCKFLKHIEFTPDLCLIKADATRRNHICHIAAVPGKKVLLMGDTHHMSIPLQTMLHYASAEPWDLISSEHDRHHLPFFKRGGLSRLIWLPCFTMNPSG